jgi:hypothetical protein
MGSASVLAMITRIAALGFSVALVACGSDDEPTPEKGALAAPPVGAGLQLSLEIDVPSGVEGTWCRYFVLPDEPHDIRRYESRYTPISHHLLLYQSSLSEAEVPTLDAFDCDDQDRFEGVTGFHYGTQSHEDYTEFPDGFGKKHRAREVVLLEYHAINTTGVDVSAEARVNLWFATEGVQTLVETLFFYNPIIAIPPHGGADASMHCEMDANVSLLDANHHMHRRGVGFDAVAVDGSGGTTRPIAESASQDPETVRFDPPFEIHTGDRIDFSCHYQNDGASTVFEGDSAVANEMCVFAANYVSPPGEVVSIPTRLCDAPGSGAYMNGTENCSTTVACVDATRTLAPGSKEASEAIEVCYVEACNTGYVLEQELLTCRYEFCKAECVDPPGAINPTICEPCVQDHCQSQAAACSSNACD